MSSNTIRDNWCLLLAIVFICIGNVSASANSISGNGKLPNIVLIVTDDQDVVLHGLVPMTATQKFLSLKGVTFANAFTSSPICCPSRASILTGQYAHNHATCNNSMSGGCYGDFWRERVEPRALPIHLKKLGFETFFAGKYLNEYKVDAVPPGWDQFFGLHGNSKYYNYTLTENGKTTKYTDEYLTDVLSVKATEFIMTAGRRNQPFFAMVSTPAPHAPYTPAPRHANAFKNTKAPRTPNFNMISGSLDKHWLVAMSQEIPNSVLDIMDTYYQKRWQSLLAVDDLVENLVRTLEKIKQIDNTYIVFTSDNGYHIGQFSQPFDKRQPYETDIRVPLLVRGPNIPPKSISYAPVALIDLFPTMLQWANASEIPDFVDGQSFADLAAQQNDKQLVPNRQFLIEYWGEGNRNTYNPECPYRRSDNLAECTRIADCHCQDSHNNTYSCIRHFGYNVNLIYCEFNDTEHFVEAYDLQIDPYQITNLGFDMLPSERAWYSLALQHLRTCVGAECRKLRKF